MSRLIEWLETRVLFAALPPSAEETYGIELVNRARANPVLEALRYGINLNEGLPTNPITTTAKQPLALNAFLIDSSYYHSVDLQQAGIISQVGTDGSLPQDRMIQSGYVFTGTAQGSAESVQELNNAPNTPPPSQANIDEIHKNWFVDQIASDRIDRINMLTDAFKEIGSGYTSGVFGGGTGGTPGVAGVLDYALATENAGGDAFLCGVAYDDTNGNQFYDIGEGLGNVNVSARRLSDNVIFTTTTYPGVVFFDSTGDPSGAYSLRLPPGTYAVTATGGQLGAVAVQYPAVVVGTRNVKRDFTPQQSTSTPPPTPGNGGIPPQTPNPITTTGDLQGKIYVDKNGNGKKDKDVDNKIITGLHVFLDLNKDNVKESNEPFGVVLANGTWNITGLATGIYQVSVQPPVGYRISIPDEGFRTVTVSAGKLTKVKALLVTPRTIIAGTVYRDDNGDGVHNSTEKGLKNWRVYLDLNNDGVWQRETEPSRRTDKQGKYSFRDLIPSTYTLRIIPHVGYLQTEPANNGFYVVQIPAEGFSVLNRDFGEKLLSLT